MSQVFRQPVLTRREPVFRLRHYLVLFLFVLGMFFLGARAVQLQVFQHDFYSAKADARHFRHESISAHRGMVTDRNGKPLAISTPVASVSATPKDVDLESAEVQKKIADLEKLLRLQEGKIANKLADKSREFVYLRRQITPLAGKKVLALGIPGINIDREYRRYYPYGEVFGHVLGFTDIDDRGQEGIELAFNEALMGNPGKKKIMRDGRGRFVQVLSILEEARPGEDIRLTIDERIQYMAYLELKAAVEAHQARKGSAVIIDATNGEVLAMVNQPSFNPNDRQERIDELYRNRAVKDLFEPGSTIKPFTVAAALESGVYSTNTLISTSPGYYKVSGHLIKDKKNYGSIDLETIISKSSNVGASKLALTIPQQKLWSILDNVGFGQVTGSGFPGEESGLLRDYSRWYELDRATVAFGYGMAVTPLQLAQSYSVLAANGIRHQIHFLADDETGESIRVMSAETAQAVRAMMQKVVAPKGTGFRAAVEGYRVAGKTGTSKKSIAGGYSDDRYVASFAGMAPAESPKLVVVVVIDEPRTTRVYGGEVAAPVFSRIMASALRLMNIPPDEIPASETEKLLPGRVAHNI